VPPDGAATSPAAKLVFITGASSGLGQALAKQYYQQGYRLALVARRVEDVKNWVSANSINESCYQIYGADVTDADTMVRVGEQCIAQQGLPDVVIANAGISIGIDTAYRADVDVMASVLATNTVGMMATFHPFVVAMTARAQALAKTTGQAVSRSDFGGCLVGVCSVAGIRGLPGHGAYSASKAAAITYCESLRVELRDAGIHVVTLCPGYIDTPLTRKNPYSMPFLMQADDFAREAFKAIDARSSYCVIPWQMGVVGKLLRFLPNWLYDRVLAGRPRKRRQN
jgi:short-subunit dehydrogenase